MIPDVFLNAVYSMIAAIISALPQSTGLPQSVFDAATKIGGYTAIFSPLVDWSQLGIVVGIAFSVEIALFAFKTTKWLLTLIPLVG